MSAIQEKNAHFKGRYGSVRVCANGHCQEGAIAAPSELCSRCRAKVSEECTCGFPFLPGVVKDYTPRYREKWHVYRDKCPGCGKLYPWVQAWLLRPVLNQELSDYEQALAEIFAASYLPSIGSRAPSPIEFGLTSSEVSEVGSKGWLSRLFGRRITVDSPQHPKHRQWLAYQLACSAEVSRRQQYPSATVQELRKSAHAARVKELERLAAWKRLSGQDFEREFAELLRRKGYTVTHVGGPGDQGADIILQTGKGKIVVQCKAYAGVVGPQPVRDLCGSMVHYGAFEGWLVAIEGFSQSAFTFAHNKPIRLLLIGSFLDWA